MSRPRGLWPLGRVAGITVQVHWSFLLLVGWVAMAHAAAGGPSAALPAALFVVLLFGTVVLHELGHALAARAFGVRTLDITLLPIGGMARLDRIPDGALEGLTIALAGPLVSAVIAAVLLGALFLAGGWAAIAPRAELSLLAQLGWANATLCLFNLLPAFPLDGGRALRALLVPPLGPLGATRRAAQVGRAVAAALAVVSPLASPMLLLIALFIYVQGTVEEQVAEAQEALRGRTVASALARDVLVVAPETRVREAAELLRHGLQRDFPVVIGDRLLGLVGQPELLRALAAGRREATVLEVMRRDVPAVPLRLPLATALERLEEHGQQVLPVCDDDRRFVGLVGVDTIAGLLAVHAASAGAPAPRATAA